MEEGTYCLNRCRKFNMVTLLPPRILLIISFQVTYLEIYCVCFLSYLTLQKKKLLMSYYLRSEGESDLNKMKHQRQTQITIMLSFCLLLNILMMKNLEKNLLLGQNHAIFFSCSSMVSVFYWYCPPASLFPFSLCFQALPVPLMNLCLGERAQYFQAEWCWDYCPFFRW